jgi:hypothetical protein
MRSSASAVVNIPTVLHAGATERWDFTLVDGQTCTVLRGSIPDIIKLLFQALTEHVSADRATINQGLGSV